MLLHVTSLKKLALGACIFVHFLTDVWGCFDFFTTVWQLAFPGAPGRAGPGGLGRVGPGRMCPLRESKGPHGDPGEHFGSIWTHLDPLRVTWTHLYSLDLTREKGKDPKPKGKGERGRP